MVFFACTALILLLLVSVFGNVSKFDKGSKAERLECLQHMLGKEVDHTRWVRDYVSQDPQYMTKQTWIYTNERCPLYKFSEESLCKHALQCGKHLLLVGDSTVSRIGTTLPRLVNATTHLSPCPTDNYCHQKNPNSASICQKQGFVELTQTHKLCRAYCPPEQPVVVSYIRHDFLTHIHNIKYLHSTVCEHWKAVARNADYIMVSVGPHLNGMLKNPFGRPPPPDFNETAFYEQEAADTTALLSSILKPNATLIYRTGSVGVLNFSHNCSAHPSETLPAVQTNYSWDKIPLLNAAYIRHLQGDLGLGLGQRANNSNSGNGNASSGSGETGPGTGAAVDGRSVLVMDTTTLMSKIYGCRDDYMHFNTAGQDSPVLLEWLILYNLLLEHNRPDKNAVH